MNREIKFRAWDKEKKRMIEVQEMNFNYENRWVVCGEIVDLDAPIMQYTGLKDKNGKEIYEGDILEFEEESFSWGDPGYIVRRVVKWDTYYGACWNFGTSYKDGDKRWSYPIPFDCEVIGNIYENPELLGETK